MITATETHLATIRARRIDATARAMMAEGVTLTHDIGVKCAPVAPTCDHCGHPIAPEGVALDDEEDVDTTGAERPRCSDTACTC